MQIKKKIILTGSIPPPYHGSSIYFSNLLNSRMKEEFNVSHLDISDHRNLDNLSRLDFTNIYLALKNIFKLFKMLRRKKPELVYIPVASNFLPYLRDGLFILTTSYFSKAKIVIHLHEGKYFREGFYNNSNFLVRKFIKYSLEKVDTAIVLSDSLKGIFKGLVSNIEICPNGIIDEYNFNRKEIIAGDKLTISFLGNLFESKGVIEVLNAAKIILQKYSNVEFQLAGAWSDKEPDTKIKAENVLKDISLKEKIKFEGVVTGKKKKDFLRQTDILVFPTWYKHEGFPLVILEAMSSGIAVISTKDTGAIPDIVDDGKTGLLVERKNVLQITNALIKLIENPGLRKEMGKTGREKFEHLYTLEININKMIDIFNKTINQYIVEKSLF